MLARHTFVYFLSHGVPGLVSFMAVSIYSHMLAPSEYGLYALVLVASGFINSVLFQWLRLSLLRFLPGCQDDDERTSMLGTVLFGFLLLVGGTGILSLLGYFTIGAGRGIGLFWVLATLIGWSQAWLELNLTLLRSRLSPVSYGMLSFSKAVLSLAAGVTLAALHYGAYGLLAGMMFGMLVPLLVPSWRFWREPLKRMSVDGALMKSMLAYGLPLTLTFALGVVIHYTDRVVLGYFLGPDATGIYSLAYDFSENTLMTVMMVVNLSAFPLLMRTFEQDGREAAKRQMKQNFVLLTALSLPVAVGIISLAPNISGVLFGHDFEESAAVIIPIITAAAWLRGMKSFYLDISFQFGRKTLKQIIPAALAAVINVVLNLILVPLWGIQGSIAATLAAYSAASAVTWNIGRKLFPMPLPMKDFAAAAAASLIMSAALFPLRELEGAFYLALQVAVGILAYALAAILLNVAGIRGMIRRRAAGMLRGRQSKRQSKRAETS